MGKKLTSKDTRAVILAGGKGTRLRPLTAVLAISFPFRLGNFFFVDQGKVRIEASG